MQNEVRGEQEEKRAAAGGKLAEGQGCESAANELVRHVVGCLPIIRSSNLQRGLFWPSTNLRYLGQAVHDVSRIQTWTSVRTLSQQWLCDVLPNDCIVREQTITIDCGHSILPTRRTCNVFISAPEMLGTTEHLDLPCHTVRYDANANTSRRADNAPKLQRLLALCQHGSIRGLTKFAFAGSSVVAVPHVLGRNLSIWHTIFTRTFVSAGSMGSQGDSRSREAGGADFGNHELH
jgi:hypothetical protein